MNISKKIIPSAIAASILLSFTACGGGGGSSSPTTTTKASTINTSGTGVDGYIDGGTACLDLSLNGLIAKGAIFQTFMDTENLIHLIAKSEEEQLTPRIMDAVKKIEGAFSLVFLSRTKMFAMRDRFGFRPLSLGRLPNGGYIVASETCAFDLVGAEFVRDVEPGELLIFKEGREPKSIKVFEPTPKHCIFEYVYFARPDSSVFGQSVYQTRKNMGKELAKIDPIEADVVIPVPDGGVPSAIGYSQESGIPYEMGIMRNHYIGRTFIEPTQEMRDLKVKMKLSPMTDIIKGQTCNCR